MTTPANPTIFKFAAAGPFIPGPPFSSASGPQMFISGKNFYDQNSAVKYPYGFNLDGLEDNYGGGNNPYDWDSPVPAAVSPQIFTDWKPQVVQFYLNINNILGQSPVFDTGGGKHYPNGTNIGTAYLQQVADNIAKLQSLGIVCILTIRNNAPDTTVPGQSGPQKMFASSQNVMLDYINGDLAINALCEWFGCPNGTATSTYGPINFGGIGIGVYNEPTVGNGGSAYSGGLTLGNYTTIDGASTQINAALIWAIVLGSKVDLGNGLGTYDYSKFTLTKAADVTTTNFNNASNSYSVNWQVMDCQTFINAWRAAGGQNIIFINASNYTNPVYNSSVYYNYGGWAFINNNPNYLPTDPLVAEGYPAQIAMNWHVYNFTGNGTPGSGQGGGMWSDFCNLPIPSIVLETGDDSGGSASNFFNPVSSWADTNQIGTLWWTLNPGSGSMDLITNQNGNGNPSYAYAKACYSWMNAK